METSTAQRNTFGIECNDFDFVNPCRMRQKIDKPVRVFTGHNHDKLDLLKVSK